MKKIFLIFAACAMMIFGALGSASVIAADCAGIEVTGGCPGEFNNGGDEGTLRQAVANVLNALYFVVAIIAVVVIVIGGVMYMTAAGDPGKIQTAKNAIIYAIIGLVIAVLAYAITAFIIGALQ